MRAVFIIVVALCAFAVAACSPTPPNFVAIDPAKRTDTWALQRADIDCKAQVGSEKWGYRFRLMRRADPEYVSCMGQKGFVAVPASGARAMP